MPKRWCLTCKVLFDMDSTGTLRCPACQATATTARQHRDSTTTRGYGTQHQQARRQYLEQWQPGDPCAHCGEPTMEGQPLDLAHNADRTGWLGLAHRRCNRADGANPGRTSK